MGKAATAELDDNPEDLTLDVTDPKAGDPPEDDGNTPDTPEQIAAAEAARKLALKQVAGDDDDPDEGKGKFIPKGRFDEVNLRMQRAEKMAEEASAALAAALTAAGKPAAKTEPAAAEFDLKATMKARLAALASGDDDKALELDEKIQAHTLSEARRLAREDMRAENVELTAKQQQTEMARTAAELVKAYPQLDPKSPDVDADAIDFVVARRDRLMAEGRPAHEALRLAVDVAAKRFGFEAGRPSPTNSDPQAARIEAARVKAAAAAMQQPPELGGKGNRATQPAREKVEDMTDDEFAALPDAEKKRLRGDV